MTRLPLFLFAVAVFGVTHAPQNTDAAAAPCQPFTMED